MSDHSREFRRSNERRHRKGRLGRSPGEYGDDEGAGRSRPRFRDDEDAPFNWRSWQDGDDSEDDSEE